MVHDDFNEKLDRFTRGIIRRKIKQLIGRAGITPQDREDLEQDFYVRVLQSLLRYRPSIGHRNKYVTAVVERYVANVLRHQRASKRDYRRLKSLHVTIDVKDEGPVELISTLDQHLVDDRLGREQRCGEDLADLAIDLADLLSSLPAEWRTLLELRKSHSMPQAAEMMGVPRTTLNEWMRQIRRRFERAGMRDYL